jgi:hypothetical protein
MDPSLSAALGTKYQKNISTYYPYIPLVRNSPSGSKWLPAVLGAVLGVVGLLFILFIIWWFLFRGGRKSATSGTQSSGGRVRSWVNGVSNKPDASDTTTDVEEPRSPPHGDLYEVLGDWKYYQANSGNPETEAAVTHGLATPRLDRVEADGAEVCEMHGTNTHPASPRSAHVEADATERYEMHAFERGSPDTLVEMVASYRFRDHSLYPLDPAGLSQAMSPTLGARSTTSHDASPCVLPQRLIETDYAISHPAADSSQDAPTWFPPVARGAEPSAYREFAVIDFPERDHLPPRAPVDGDGLSRHELQDNSAYYH